MFENDWDFTYFQYFCGETCYGLSGVFEFAIWNRIVLQASFHHPFIRHAIITLANMSKNVKSALNRPEHVVSHTSPTSQACRRALRHYNRFLEDARKALDGGHQPTRIALIVCLLIICVETLQWHHHQALHHIYAGTNLLDEWMSINLKMTSKPQDVSSSLPDFIEDEIVQQFRTLEVEASSLFDPRPKSYHEKHLSEGLEAIQTMPRVFSNMQEARLYLDLIRRRIRYFIGSLRPGKVGRSNLQPEFESPGFRTSFDTLEPFPSLSECTKHNQEQYATEIRRWEAAFEPLFLSTSPTKKEYLGIQLLRIRSNILHILLYGELTHTEMIYDTFLPEFTEIVTLSRSFSTHPDSEKIFPKGGFSSNNGLIYPLRLVADKCRDRNLRREAIALISSRPWREGCWWSRSNAQLGAWLMTIEEEGAEGEFVPEWARARLLDVNFYEDGKERRAKVSAVRGKEVKVAEWNWSLGFQDSSEPFL
jgi:hypothetical protein